MNWWKRLFGRRREPESVLDQIQAVARVVICGSYRNLGAGAQCAPTAATSDDRIMEIYTRVGTAFREVSITRGEHLTAGQLNGIVFKFLQIEETFGPAMVDEHLRYEVDKYLREGLREDYQRELRLFPD